MAKRKTKTRFSKTKLLEESNNELRELLRRDRLEANTVIEKLAWDRDQLLDRVVFLQEQMRKLELVPAPKPRRRKRRHR